MLNGVALTALGTMSGTSLDGVDAAVLETDGVTIFDFGPSAYRPYSAEEQAVLRAHLGRWQGEDIAAAADLVARAHIAVMAPFANVALAGFHGQTLAHDPARGRSHQCGDGQVIADALGYPVVWDFRSADIAAGGQGAPLVPFYHFALAKWARADGPVAFVNLGGVGNITWVDPRCDDPSDAGALLAFDTGPANAPINDLMQAHFDLPYDAGGARALGGQADADALAQLRADPYFAAPPPKSLDRDHFAAWQAGLRALAPADGLATAARGAGDAVAWALAHCPIAPQQIWIAGGGRHNAAVMAAIAAQSAAPIAPIEDLGLNGDMIEAQAFAYLAVRALRGLPLSAPMTTGAPAPIRGGKIAAPR